MEQKNLEYKKSMTIDIIEDHLSIAEHIRDLINIQEDMKCTNIYQDAEWGLRMAPKSRPDILIVDIKLPQKNGIECVKELKPILPDTQFLMYTIFDQNDELFMSLKAGANGYLLKKADDKEIIRALRELYAGGSPMSPSIARKVTDFFFNRTSQSKKLEVLSEREKEILSLLAKGLQYKEIADQLFLATGTIKQHIHRIYKKLHVNNRGDASNLFLGID